MVHSEWKGYVSTFYPWGELGGRLVSSLVVIQKLVKKAWALGFNKTDLSWTDSHFLLGTTDNEGLSRASFLIFLVPVSPRFL